MQGDSDPEGDERKAEDRKLGKVRVSLRSRLMMLKVEL